MNKILNAVGNLMLFGGWLMIMLCLLVIDVIQLDALTDHEMTWVFYGGITAVYFIGYWVFSKIGLSGSGVDDGFDFFD